MERLEAGALGEPVDPFDLGLEAVAGRRHRLARVHLEILGSRVDVVAEFRKQRVVGGLGWKDAAGNEDDRPTAFPCHGIKLAARVRPVKRDNDVFNGGASAGASRRSKGGRDVGDLALRLAMSPQRRLLGPEGLRLLRQIVDELPVSDTRKAHLRREAAALASQLAEREVAFEAPVPPSSSVMSRQVV